MVRVSSQRYPTVQMNFAPFEIPLMIGMIADDVDWVSVNTTTAAQHSHRAFIAGKEGWDGSPLWAIRAHYNGEFVPGKFAAKHRAAYIPMQGKEIPVHNFEVSKSNSYYIVGYRLTMPIGLTVGIMIRRHGLCLSYFLLLATIHKRRSKNIAMI